MVLVMYLKKTRNQTLDYSTLFGGICSRYLNNRYFGNIIGRVANRVAEGLIYINGKKYELTKNDENQKNHINGGIYGFDNVNWDSCVSGKQVVMSNLSKTGSEGYPGHMLTQVKYTWTDLNELHINIRATSTEATPANITNYCLFNLAGHGMGVKELRKHIVTINADKWTLMDIRDNLPIGLIEPVDQTVYDLRTPTQLNKQTMYNVPGGGYNHNLCITTPSCWCYRFHARILHPDSGRFLEVYSNQPGLQFYTGNDLPDPNRNYPPDHDDYYWGGCGDSPDKTEQNTNVSNKNLYFPGKDGVLYRRHGGFVLSPQNYPDAVNIESFPSCILHPGKMYTHDMTYRFGVRSKM
ncbi:aldose 1-epimerase isoform X2 [Cephus cinctus]|uniref:Galactose mutarotase n=1 Tax=Cephus cinctus TaxID=211228 RepID=A0AAJ7W7B6_CEPCN|nr:aldose 1-epimerase isoform X2 [Cephus cinctus]